MTEPNKRMADIHDRIPVVLPPNDHEPWLDPKFQSKDKLSMLRAFPAGEMMAVPISTVVINPRNETSGRADPSQ